MKDKKIIWKSKSLNCLGTFSRGVSKHRPRNDLKLFLNGDIPFIQTADVKKSILYIESNSQSYNLLGLKQSKLWDTGTLCITIAANIAETGILKYPMCFPDSIVGFSSNVKESIEIFVYYIFEYIKQNIQKISSGSIQNNINIEFLSTLKFKVPPVEYQKLIAKILSLFDIKINLNNKINDNLEKQMKLLFDYWFVQFEFPNENGKPYKSSGGKMYFNDKLNLKIPYTWNQCSLKEYANNIITGKTPSKNKESYFNGNIPFVTIPDLRDNLFIINTEQKLSKFGADYQKSKYLPKDSLCISCIATLGEFSFTTEVCQTNQQINSIIFKEKFIKEFAYFFLKNIFENLSVKTGNTFKNMNKEEFSQIKILSPAKEVVYDFHRIANIIFKKIENNCFENKRLISLRDFLLPLLMNGQAIILE